MLAMYKRVIVFLCWLLVFCGYLVIAGEKGTENQPLKLAVDLVDGSHVIGVPSVTSLDVRTPFADMNLPLKIVQEITFGGEEGKARITLQNGDALSASLNAKSLGLNTLFGAVDVPLSIVKGLYAASGDAAPGLVLYYTFDKDRDGKVIDQGGRGFNGTISGNVLYEKSFKGKAARFTAKNSYIVCEAKELNMNGWRQVTVSAWVLFRKLTTYACVLSRGAVTEDRVNGVTLFAGGTYGGSWYHNMFRVLKGEKAEDVYGVRFQGTYPKLGKWYHMAGTYDGKNLCLYVDGELDASREVPDDELGISDNPANKLVIGTEGAQSRINSWEDMYVDGLVDEVRVYNRCLSREEIKGLYKDCSSMADRFGEDKPAGSGNSTE